MMIKEKTQVHPNWYKGLTVNERLTRPLAESSLPESDSQKLTVWKNKKPFNNPLVFKARLQADGLTEAQFSYLLNETPAALSDRFLEPPTWVSSILGIFEEFKYFTLPEDLNKEVQNSFLIIIRPLINYAYNRLQTFIDEIQEKSGQKLFTSEAIHNFYSTLFNELLDFLTPATLLEIHSAKLLNLLQGNSPEKRFENFLQQFNEPQKGLNFLQSYPVLARHCFTYITYWLEARFEFIERLVEDWGDLVDTFELNPQAYIVGINDKASDRHAGGRRVFILEFTNNFKLVYKPRSLDVDEYFQNLLTWFENKGLSTPLLLPQILNRKKYGWVQFIVHNPCSSTAEVGRFYKRIGNLIALFYFIRGTDFHNENLIAYGEYPIPIDLEALFHPETPYQPVNFSETEKFFQKYFYTSVISTLLLPVARKQNLDRDSNGLVELAEVEKTQLVLENKNTDEIRYVRKTVIRSDVFQQNKPYIKDESIQITDYVADILQGFQEVYKIIEHHQAELLAENSVIQQFADVPVRFLFRDTQTYYWLMRQMTQTKEAADGLYLDRTLDGIWGRIQGHSNFAYTVPFEKQDLCNLDIPFFTTRPGSRHLWSSTKEVIPNFLENNALSLVCERITQANDKDLQEQLFIIQASFACVMKREEIVKPKTGFTPLPRPTYGVIPEQPLKLAQKIAQDIEKMGLHYKNEIAWITIEAQKQEYFLGTRGYDVFSGAMGLALFYAQLAHTSQDDTFKELAWKMVKVTRSENNPQSTPHTHLLGAYDGVGGMIYAFTYLSLLWKEEELLKEAIQWGIKGEKLLDKAQQVDVLSGIAGYLLSLLSLQKATDKYDLTLLLKKCGDKLITLLNIQENEPNWTPPPAYRLRPGFAQGWTGIAYTFLTLADTLNAPHYAEVGRKIIVYEQSLLTTQMIDTTWLNGWAGIALAYSSHPEMKKYLNLAQVWPLLEQSFGQGDHSVGYGDSGFLECLHLLHTSFPAEIPHPAAYIHHFAQEITTRSSQSTFPFGIHPVGFIHGLAGIGYTLLRFSADPQTVPSVLLLQLPQK